MFDGVLPDLRDSVTFILHQVPQPWHPQGTYVHEAALAVKDVNPERYPAFVRDIYSAFEGGKFTDDCRWN